MELKKSKIPVNKNHVINRAFYEIVIIGGGPSGICAAISAARTGRRVLICEKNERIGRKLLATGDGRCNLLNEDLNEKHYNLPSRYLVRHVFERFNKEYLLQFFNNLGLKVYTREDGRIFPITNQASSVLTVLEIELKKLNIPVEYEFNCNEIKWSGKDDVIAVSSSSGETIFCHQLIITGGGKTYPALGSDGSTLKLATELGHSVIHPVPCAVPIEIKDPLCSRLQGQKIIAEACTVINNLAGDRIRGELLFTRYGLSGTAILDISENISIAINRKKEKNVLVEIDLIPFLSEPELKETLILRKQSRLKSDQILVGILPNKISVALKDLFEDKDPDQALKFLKHRLFKVSGTRGWNEAEFTAGGVCVDEINPLTLESKLKKNIFFAGEVLDVNGKRGGYNLAWAWASGLLAGFTGSY